MPTTPRSTTIGAAAGATLAVIGAAAALFMTLGGGTSAQEPSDPGDPVIVTEYVDEFGNPVAAPTATAPAAPPPVIELVDAATGEPIEAAPAPTTSAAPYDEDEDDDYEDDDHDEDEDEDEDEDDDYYEDEGDDDD